MLFIVASSRAVSCGCSVGCIARVVVRLCFHWVWRDEQGMSYLVSCFVSSFMSSSWYSENELISHLQRINGDERPSSTQVDSDEQAPSAATYRNRFGSFGEACLAAGYDAEYSREKYSDDELITYLQENAVKWYGPGNRMLREMDGPSAQVYESQFDDGLREATRKAGLTPYEKRGERDEIIKQVQEIYEGNGLKSFYVFNNADWAVAPSTARKRFDSIEQLCEEAGLTYLSDSRKEITMTEFIDGLVNAGEPEEVPTKREIDACEDAPSYPTYLNEFGSLRNAVEEVGYDPKDMHRGNTDIERSLYAILDRMGIEYVTEKPFGNYRVDAYLPSEQIAIEADGQYWHGHPQKFQGNQIQRKIINSDKKKNSFLESQGVYVCRFWGDTIKGSPKRVQDTVEKLIDGEREVNSGEHVFGPEPSL